MTDSPSNIPAAADRAEHRRRADYVARTRQDEFIVSNLRVEIEAGLRAASVRHGRGARVLDLGCGAQPFRGLLEDLGFAYTSSDAIQNQFQTVDVLCLVDRPLPDELSRRGPFDFVLCTEVLEHVRGWPQAWANIHALLKPGGTALITCPFMYPLHEQPHDFWRATPFSIREHAEVAGLHIDDLRQLGDPWQVLATMMHTMEVSAKGPGGWLARKSFGALRRTAFAGAKSGWLSRHVPSQSLVYLSNLAVVRRP